MMDLTGGSGERPRSACENVGPDGTVSSVSSKPGTATSSKYCGVSWDARNKAWLAQMTHSKAHGGDGKQKFLGLYDDERSAALAVDAFVRERMPGIVEKLIFPDMDPLDLARDLVQAKKRRQDKSSQYHGVYWHANKKRWCAKITHSKAHGGDGKQKFLGHYDDERSAALVVDAFIREDMPGLTAKLNFPDMGSRDLARDLAQVQRRGRHLGAAAPSRKRPRSRSSPVVAETVTRSRLLDQPVPSTREERMLAIAASPTARALFRLVTAHRSRLGQS